ncbi:hypothetical protein PIB30_073310, partial [Stylosanthes scabra]|nr:hypothetical protein [Stylosanthes scabra]
ETVCRRLTGEEQASSFVDSPREKAKRSPLPSRRERRGTEGRRKVGIIAGTGVDSGGGDTAEGVKAGFESGGLREGEPSREIERVEGWRLLCCV